MFQAYLRSLILTVPWVLLLLAPALASSGPGVDWVRVHPYYEYVTSGCICDNVTLRLLIADTLVALDLEGHPEWNLSWEEDNSITTLARMFDNDCGVCFIEQLVDEPKSLIMYKYDSAGTFLWEAELKLSDELSGLSVVDTDNKGNAYLVCDLRENLSRSDSRQRIQVFKVRPDGKVEWQTTDDKGMASISNPGITRRWTRDPLAYVDTLGVATIVTSDAQLFRIFRYNADGALIWDQTFDPVGRTGSSSYRPVTSIMGLPQGNVVLTTSAGPIRCDTDGICDTTFEFPVIRLSKLDAQSYFEQNPDRSQDLELECSSWTFDERGNLCLMWNHDRDPDGDSHIEVRKYDPRQRLIWSKTYGEYDRASQTANEILTRNGLVIVTGKCYDQLGRSDGLILVYDDFGNLLLDKRYDSPEHMGDEITSTLINDKGNIFVFGVSVPISGVGNDAVFMLKLSAE